MAVKKTVFIAESLMDAFRLSRSARLNRPPTQAGKGSPVLFWYCKTENGWRYLKAESTAAPGVEAYPEGHFVIRRMIDGKRVYDKAAANVPLKDALKQAAAETRETSPLKMTLRDAKRYYVNLLNSRGTMAAEHDADYVLDEFLQLPDLPRTVEGIREQHLNAFCRMLAAKNSPRTIENKNFRVRFWLKACGVDLKTVPNKLPQAERPEVTVYDPSELRLLLAHADDPYTRIVIEMGIRLGLRDAELRHAEFTDFDRNRLVYTVRSKPLFKFATKKNKSRSIPFTEDLLSMVDAWQRIRPAGTTLILARGTGRDNLPVSSGALYNRIGRVAKRAKLTVNDPRPTWTHKLRRTAITTWLRSGVDIATVKKWAGHDNVGTTMRYSAAMEADAPETQNKIASIRYY
jgi:integrase